jgi:isoquinoline 1-oxidoreductase beta subunit
LQAQQSTGGSWGVRYWYMPLRKGAAQAREMLISAAAARLGVAASELEARDGFVVHDASGRKLNFGELAAEASSVALPAEPPLRPRSARRHVGSSLQRPDIPDKVRGKTVFSADFKRPNMVYACARLAPVHGARLVRVGEVAARKDNGVLGVVPLPNGAAAVAQSSWAAMRGVAALQLEFEKTPGDALDSDAIRAAMREGLGAETKAVARNDGDFDDVRAAAARVVTADYEVPYLNHAPMETWSCTVELGADGTVDIWAPIQAQDRARTTAASTLGVPAEKVRIHTLLLGGAFGRRLNDDGIGPAVLVAQAVRRPVKFFWTRETEFAVGWGRPAYMARFTAALDKDNRVVGLHVRTSGPSMRIHFGAKVPADELATYVDGAAVQNLGDIRYRFGAYRLDYSMRHNHFPTGPWRAVGATQNAFFMESFIDEIAHATSKDPIALRRELLAHDARALKVIDELAARSNWGSLLPEGRARGCAYFECYGSLCAQVAEVSLEGGRPRVHRVVSVLDCGEVITPDGARAQVEGGIVQGLSAALGEAQTLKNGAAVELNFDRYQLLRAPDAPRVIETHFIASHESLGGVGEPPLPPIAPALTNAMRMLTGKPIRRLPLA